MLGQSKFGRGFNASFPITPTLRPTNKAHTTQARVIIEGTRDSGQYIDVTGPGLIPLINYIDRSKWFHAADLAAGLNQITLKGYDNIYHRYSDNVVYEITRHAITTAQYKRYRVLINGVDYSNKVEAFSVDSDNKFTANKAEITLTGNYLTDENIDFDHEIIIEIDDGFLNILEEQFTGKIDNKRIEIRGAEKTTVITALHKIIETLDEETALTVKGIYNGEVQKRLLADMGFNDVWAFNRYKYTGRRYFNSTKKMDVIKGVASAQCELIEFAGNSTVNMIPDEYLSYPLYEFDESQVYEISVEENKAGMFNKINVLYGEPETGTNNKKNISNLQTPATDEGTGFFTDENLKNEIIAIPKTGTIYFACWSKTVDIENIDEAFLTVHHSNTDYNINDLVNVYPLDLDADAGMAYAEIKLNKLALGSNSKLTFELKYRDTEGNEYKPQIFANIDNDSASDTMNYILNQFEALFTSEITAAEVEESFTVDDISPANNKIVYFDKSAAGSKIECSFLYKIPLASECVLDTVYLDLATVNNDKTYLKNCTIKTAGNIDISGNAHIRAVTFADPKTCYNKVKNIFVMFEVDSLSGDQKIEFKFKVYGRTLKADTIFEDFETIQSTNTNQNSVTKYGPIDGGYLLSNYLSTRKQAENIGGKLVEFFGWPLTKCKLQLPLLSELRKNITVKVISPNSGINTYYFITAINKTFDGCEAEAYKLRTTKVKRNQGVDSEYDIYSRNMADFSISLFLNSFNELNRGLEKGTVLVRHRTRTCDVKVFSGAKKYINVNVLYDLDVRKDDKVLVATGKDGAKIIIAVLEKAIDNITPNGAIDDGTDGNGDGIEDASGRALDKTKNTNASSNEMLALGVNTIYLWDEANHKRYEKTPKTFTVAIRREKDIKTEDILKRLRIYETNTEATVGPIDCSTNANYLYINGVRGKAGTRYTIEIQATAADPLYSTDRKTKMEKTLFLGIETEPVFKIQTINVLNPNMFEVVLTHPLDLDVAVDNDKFLIK